MTCERYYNGPVDEIVPDSVVNLPEGRGTCCSSYTRPLSQRTAGNGFLNGQKITFYGHDRCALILGVIIGLLIAVVRTAHDSHHGQSNIILSILKRSLQKLYLTVIRGTPYDGSAADHGLCYHGA